MRFELARVDLCAPAGEARRVPKLRRARSGRIPVIVVEQATEARTAKHPAVLIRRPQRTLEQHVVEALVVPLGVVVRDELTNGPP